MDTDLRHILPLLIPIVGIVMGIGVAMLAIWTDYMRKRTLFELHHKERLAAIERGMEVAPLPAEFFQQGRRRIDQPAMHLRNGLVWLLVGLALMVALAVNRSPESAAWGLLPTAVGLAQLIFYAVTSRQAAQRPLQDPPRGA